TIFSSVPTIVRSRLFNHDLRRAELATSVLTTIPLSISSLPWARFDVSVQPRESVDKNLHAVAGPFAGAVRFARNPEEDRIHTQHLQRPVKLLCLCDRGPPVFLAGDEHGGCLDVLYAEERRMLHVVGRLVPRHPFAIDARDVKSVVPGAD